jgi:hypothetical protein
MSDTKIVYCPETCVGLGDFNARVENGAIVLPAALERINRNLGVFNGETFFSVVSSFPTSFCAILRWTHEETRSATDKLREQLRGAVPDSILDFDPAAQPQRSFCAMPPKGWKPPRP